MSRVRQFQVGLVLTLSLVATVFVLATPRTAEASSPTIVSVSPAQGPSIGGTLVTITGTDFQPGVLVYIGGSPAIGITLVSTTRITLTTPKASTSTGASSNVLVVNSDDGVVSLNGGYYYAVADAPLTVASVTPNSGPNTGGTMVTINGTGFSSAVAVYFGGLPGVSLNVLGSSALFVRTPPNVSGAMDVTLVNPDGTQVTLSGGFTSTGSLTVSAVTPNTGPLASGTQVTIVGAGFVRGATVKIGEAPATSVVVVNPGQIVATTPSSDFGTVRVAVTNPNGQIATREQAFAYGPPPGATLPVITNISPVSGGGLGGTIVTLSGSNFSGGATVYFGTLPSPSVTWNGQSSIFARTPSNVAGVVPVTIVNSDGSAMTLPNAFTYDAAGGTTISSVTPTSGSAAGGTIVTIAGNGFNSGSWVTFNGVPALSSSLVGTTQLSAVVPPGLSGTVTVAVTQVGGVTAQLPGGFTLTGSATTPPATTPPVTTPPATTGGTGAFAAAPIFSVSGQALVIFGGGTADQLESAASSAKATGAWVQDATGAYQLLVVGGPAFLKDQFRAKFPGGFSPNTVATLTR